MQRPRRGVLTAAGLAAALLLAGAPARAAEGMFLLDDLPGDKLQRSGLKVPLEAISRLSRAVVQVGGGGSGSFVSPRGLLVTNHHVAFGCLTRLDSLPAHKGLMERGYLAQTPEQELSCPGYSLKVVVAVRDVTAEVEEGIPAGTRDNYSQRFEQLRARKEKLRKACEADGAHVCEVTAHNGGTAYTLTTYQRIRDVRLVYAPPHALGKFGGEIDNWIYPRHTADFTFLRAYVDKAGKGAPHAADNVPLSTPVHLAVSRHGVKRGSLVLVVGFPGRTSRHVSSHAVRFNTEVKIPAMLELLPGLIQTLNARREASDEARRKYRGMEWGLQNAVKYYRMSRDGFARWKVLERKLAGEKALLAGPQGKQARALLGEIGGVYRRYRGVYPRLLALSFFSGRAVPTVRTAADIARWAVEKQKRDAKREDERFKDKNIFALLEGSERLEQEVELLTEQALLSHLLALAQKLPRGQRPRCVGALLAETKRTLAALGREARRSKSTAAALCKERFGVTLGDDPLQNAVALLYARTKLLGRSGDEKSVAAAKAFRKKLWQMSAAELSRVDDPLLRFGKAAADEARALREGPLRLVERYLAAVLHPRWVEQVVKPAYPDADFTVRLSLGSVRDYTASATGKKHRYVTDIAGLLAKDKGKEPFLVPDFVKEAAPTRKSSPWADPRIGDVPVNFTSTLDTTGGNSGSAVLDDKGRLVGLLFDGTPESILSDWQYLGSEQRSICMDIRLAAYLATLQGAQTLLEELGLKQ